MDNKTLEETPEYKAWKEADKAVEATLEFKVLEAAKKAYEEADEP